MDFGALFGLAKGLLPFAAVAAQLAVAVAHFFVVRKNKQDHGLLIDNVAAAIVSANARVNPAPQPEQPGGGA